MGPVCGLVAERAFIQSVSCHSYAEEVTIEAVAGGLSVARAIGSALVRREPSEPRTSYLYRLSSVTSGMKSSHTPVDPNERIGCTEPSHSLKSPTTRTARAFGAQTANEVPRTGPMGPVSYTHLRAHETDSYLVCRLL